MLLLLLRSCPPCRDKSWARVGGKLDKCRVGGSLAPPASTCGQNAPTTPFDNYEVVVLAAKVAHEYVDLWATHKLNFDSVTVRNIAGAAIAMTAGMYSVQQ